MSIKNREVPFSFFDNYYGRVALTGIIELGVTERGSFIIHGWTTPKAKKNEPRGSYVTSLPISRLDFRLANPKFDKAAFCRMASNSLDLWDDWGKAYNILAPKDVIDTLVKECISQKYKNKVKK
jgi:hypothetical protein